MRELLDRHFDEEELRNLLVEFGLEWDDLPAATKEGKARELVAYCERRGQVEKLLRLCRQGREHVIWPQL